MNAAMIIDWKKRLAAGGSALLLACSLTACDLGKKDPASNASTQTTEGAGTTASTASTAAPTTGTTAPTRDETLPSVAWVTADSMHVRSGPGRDYEAIGGTKMGEQVQILAKEGDWYKIQILQLVGYVSGQYLTFEDPKNAPAATTPAATTTTAVSWVPKTALRQFWPQGCFSVIRTESSPKFKKSGSFSKIREPLPGPLRKMG